MSLSATLIDLPRHAEAMSMGEFYCRTANAHSPALPAADIGAGADGLSPRMIAGQIQDAMPFIEI